MRFEYLFSDEYNNQFLVTIEKLSPASRSVEIKREALVNNKYDTHAIVKTNIYKIIETEYGSILPKFLEENTWVDLVLIIGIKKENEIGSESSKRSKICYRYLKNNSYYNKWDIIFNEENSIVKIKRKIL